MGTYSVEIVSTVLAVEVASAVADVAGDAVVELGELSEKGELQPKRA